MKESKSIAFGAYGSALTFTKSKLKRSNGTMEYYNFLKVLCSTPNIDKVYILSPSDYNKAPTADLKELDPNNKMVLVWNDPKAVRPSVQFYKNIELSPSIVESDKINAHLKLKGKYNCIGEAQNECISALSDYMKDKEFVQTILYLSHGTSNWNVPNAKKTKSGFGNSSLVAGFNYSSPIAHFLNNNLDKPYYIVLPDPRWGGKEKWGIMIDNFKSATAVLAQYDHDTEWRHVTEYDCTKLTTEFEYKYDQIKFEYKEVEKVTSICKDIISPETDRLVLFNIAAMQAKPEAQWEKDYRYKELKKWILDNDDSGEWQIFGKWSPECTKKHANFKGLIDNQRLDEMFEKTKYTLIIPIMPDWVTSKYIEMLSVGVLPLFHPDYDTQYHILPKDHILRIKDPAHMKKMIQYFEDHPVVRIATVKELQRTLLSNVTNGHFLTDMLNETNKEHQIDLQFDYPKFKKPKKNKLLSLFV